MQSCKHKTVRDGKTSFFSVFRASSKFAPSQLARGNIAAQILWLTDFRAKERLLAVYVRVQKGSFSIDDDDRK